MARALLKSAPMLAAAVLGSLVQVASFGSNPAGLGMYEYVPSSLPAHAPLVVVLHGCTEGASDAASYGWNAIADRAGFAVVYAEQTTANNAMRCFNWAGVYGDASSLERGKGENESIKEMVDHAVGAHGLDPKRVFVMGFSAGAAEALLMLATWPDVFAAGASVAGIAYDCATSVMDAMTCMNPGKDQSDAAWGDAVRKANPGYAGPWPRVSLWQGTKDSVVSPKNLAEEIKQWTNVNGVASSPSSTDAIGGASHHVFGDGSGAPKVESWEIDGMDHAVPIDPSNGCGAAAAYIVDEKICAVQHIAEFFGNAGAAAGGGSGSAGGAGGSSGAGAASACDSGGSGSGGCAVSGGGGGDAIAIVGLGVIASVGVRRRTRNRRLAVRR